MAAQPRVVISKFLTILFCLDKLPLMDGLVRLRCSFLQGSLVPDFLPYPRHLPLGEI